MIVARRNRWKLSVYVGLVFACALTAVAQDKVAPPADPPSTPAQQRVLDLLAAPVPQSSTLPKLPSSYAAWTEEQRTTAPRQIQARCVATWTMMNSGGKIQLLPPAQDPADTPKLVLEICVTGKMPRDWPKRETYIADIQRILERSRELGEPLSLPQALQP